MRLGLWQRIFIGTISLLGISHLLGFYLFGLVMRDQVSRMNETTAEDIARDVSGLSLDLAATYARLASRGRQTVWLTNIDGTPIAGLEFPQKPPYLEPPVNTTETGDITLMEMAKGPRHGAMAVVQLKEGPFRLCILYNPPPRPNVDPLIFQLLIPVLLVGGTLALWIAWRVSRPLRRLRDELREMTVTGPGAPITIDGDDEIAEVAKAVNLLSEGLSRHMRGMRDLVANVSHELRSPLARANLALGIMEEALPEAYTRPTLPEKAPGQALSQEETVAKYLISLQNELNHMDTLIDTTLLTQKLALQEYVVDAESVDFSTLCDEACEKYQALLERRTYVFTAAIRPGMFVRGNRTLLMQMLSNLLDNCLKYTTAHGEIQLTLAKRRDKCCLSLENSHEGMDQEKLDHIFDPFYRVDQHTGTGVGLGLSLVQKTIDLHGGDIMALPTDIGVCLCVQLPLDKDMADA